MKKTEMIKISLCGKEYPCRITMGAMLRFKNCTGYDVSEIKPGNLGDMILFVWCCVKSACNADDISFDLTLEDFADKMQPDTLNGFYVGIEDAEKKTQVLTQQTE